MSRKEKEQVIWKQYPEFNFIEVNYFGEVRTVNRTVTCKNGRKIFVKGRALKQQLNNKGYLYVEFRVKGKKVRLFVHRMVAITFLPNPNGYPEVNHKDNNPKNNAISNLEWCTRKYNNDYKKNFGTTSAEVLGSPVVAFDLKNSKIYHFRTQMEAGRKLKIPSKDVNNALRGRQKTAHGFLFANDESEIAEERIREIKSNMQFRDGVVAINLSDFNVFYFKSQTEASRQLNIFLSNINKVVKGKLNKTGGYWFCYADKNAVEKTRVKFGDKVARKVEKLMNNEL